MSVLVLSKKKRKFDIAVEKECSTLLKELFDLQNSTCCRCGRGLRIGIQLIYQLSDGAKWSSTCVHCLVFFKAVLVDTLVVAQCAVVDLHTRGRSSVLGQHMCYKYTQYINSNSISAATTRHKFRSVLKIIFTSHVMQLKVD